MPQRRKIKSPGAGPPAPNRDAPYGYHINKQGETTRNTGRRTNNRGAGGGNQGGQDGDFNFNKWYENNAPQFAEESGVLGPPSGLQQFLKQLAAQGANRSQLNAFVDNENSLLGLMGPGGGLNYLNELVQDPESLKAIIQFLKSNTVGPGGSTGEWTGGIQNAFFDAVPGAKDAYLAQAPLPGNNPKPWLWEGPWAGTAPVAPPSAPPVAPPPGTGTKTVNPVFAAGPDTYPPGTLVSPPFTPPNSMTHPPGPGAPRRIGQAPIRPDGRMPDSGMRGSQMNMGLNRRRRWKPMQGGRWNAPR